MTFSPSRYADLLKVITDKDYAKEKHLNVKKVSLHNNDLFIIRYIKTFLNNDNLKTLGLFRSIIVNDKGTILSFAPPKSMGIDEFARETDCDSVEFSEFCEGTMINLFWNTEVGDWELATKGTIGARCKFFQEYPKTFRYLFLEILTEKQIELSSFNKNYIYSFIIQHPDNRIVVPFDKMDIKLIQMYIVDENNDISSFNTLQELSEKIKENMTIETPQLLHKIVDCTNCSIEEVKNKFKGLNLPWKIVGAVLTNTKTGLRTKIRNPSYEYVKELKGNNPKIQFQYYSLRQSNRVREYLKFYPEKKGEFEKLRSQLHKWTVQLYQNYINCYIKKQAPLKIFPYEFRPHMFKIHRKYIEELKPINGYVSKKVVIDYVNTLEPPRLMYVINYKLRKNIIENTKNDIKDKSTTTDMNIDNQTCKE